ncbi:LysR family transcriptional regulator [Agromyces aerolatus]|uniref:LysR family transcriptional regulator n=1 Tax=Agromyces sp. LY-1074 TaxID=3074080 RepID=UPI002860EF10|nr:MULTISPECIES: LysR family transcriptional regulator [unclassified Agromyces]MDR5698583.1 LysR family transcriptional regulator [Agromyces sp. LY-1074]MDR5704877.1 LysR family transcriptional regulator [Agromyces sp. LY-1358]
MELHQFRMLRELATLGSITAVADSLGISASAVSQQLATVQRGFAAPLTRRQGRTVVLTEAGLVLADAGAKVIEAMAAAHGAVDEFEQSTTGAVQVSGFHSAGQALFGPLIAELDGSGLDVRFTDEDVAQSEFPALTARYDLVLAHRMEYGPTWPASGLQVLTLAREPLDVALPATHPLAAHAEIAPADVIGERWVTSRSGYSPDDVLVAIAAVANRPAHVAHRVNDYGVVAAIVAAGDAIGILPRYTSVRARAEDVVLRPIAGVGAARSIDLLMRPENLRRASVRLVAGGLQRVMSQLVSAT